MTAKIAFLSTCIVVATANFAYGEGLANGRYEYRSSCAACHGDTGTGNGPVGKSLKQPPVDLTALSKTNGGVFPFARVYNVIDGRLDVLAHGPREMPIWGEIYQSPRESSNPPLPPPAKEDAEFNARARILALIEYIASLQIK